MFEAGCDLPLAPELAHDAIQVETAFDDFDRDLFW
jgi:hypothetical protein